MTSEGAPLPDASALVTSLSSTGQVRTANEDSFGHFQRSDGTLLIVVADGMGGHQGGATASRTAVETIGEIFEQSTPRGAQGVLREAIELANERIHRRARADADLMGMGTTVVAFLLSPGLEAWVAHVGDSRAYRSRGGHLEPLTSDHSVVAEMLRRGLISAEEAETHPRRNEILRSVGVLPGVDVEIASVDVEPGDCIVLCSDGLSGVIRDEEIARIVNAEAPEEAGETLVRLANERGGPDNITVQLLSIPAANARSERTGAGAGPDRRSPGRGLTIAWILAALAAGAFFAWRMSRAEASPPDSAPIPVGADAIDPPIASLGPSTLRSREVGATPRSPGAAPDRRRSRGSAPR
jgi:protein phosphatase